MEGDCTSGSINNEVLMRIFLQHQLVIWSNLVMCLPPAKVAKDEAEDIDLHPALD